VVQQDREYADEDTACHHKRLLVMEDDEADGEHGRAQDTAQRHVPGGQIRQCEHAQDDRSDPPVDSQSHSEAAEEIYNFMLENNIGVNMTDLTELSSVQKKN